MAKNKMTLEEKLEYTIVKAVPYEVPENWIWSNIKSINKRVSKSINPSNFNNERFELYSVPSYDYDFPDLLNGNEIKSSKVAVEKDEILLCKINPRINRVWKVGEFSEYRKIASSEWIVINTNGVIFSNYLFYVLKSPYFRELLCSNVSGVGGSLTRARPKEVDEYPVPIPPLKEQQRIVDKIESLFEKLDKAKELIEEAREGFEKRKSSILEKAFNGDLTKNWRKHNNINKTWRQEKLKNITKITSGGTPSRKYPEYFEGDIPWIKTGEIIWNRIYDSEEHITQDAIKNSSAKLIPEGAVLVAMYGQGLTRGRAAILEKTACTNQAVCALIPNNEILNYYLYYYFMSNYWRFRQQAKGGNQENLSGKVIGEFTIEIPTVEEQKEIVRILDKLLGEESKVEELTALEEQIELIKKSILAKAFRGQLGTNCEEDESAIELLKEILKDK